jgi:hypothetical protein
VQGLHAEAQIEDEAETAQHEGHALQGAERARRLVQSELQAESDEQDRRDADRTGGITQADERTHPAPF